MEVMLAALASVVALAGTPAPPPSPIVLVLKGHLWSIHADGGGLHRLTHDKYFETDPDISPDGRTIVYIRTRPGGWGRVFTMAIDGSDIRMLTGDGKALTRSPAWSPDGRSVAFAEGLYIYIFDGHTMRRLTDSPTVDDNPAWSADGRRIAFFRARHLLTSSTLEIVGASGGKPRTLPFRFDLGAHARWHRDGRAIDVSDGEWIATIDLATGRPSRSRPPGGLGALSPDGRWTAYIGDYPEQGVYVALLDGSASPRLIYKSFFAVSIAW